MKIRTYLEIILSVSCARRPQESLQERLQDETDSKSPTQSWTRLRLKIPDGPLSGRADDGNLPQTPPPPGPPRLAPKIQTVLPATRIELGALWAIAAGRKLRALSLAAHLGNPYGLSIPTHYPTSGTPYSVQYPPSVHLPAASQRQRQRQREEEEGGGGQSLDKQSCTHPALPSLLIIFSLSTDHISGVWAFDGDRSLCPPYCHQCVVADTETKLIDRGRDECWRLGAGKMYFTTRSRVRAVQSRSVESTVEIEEGLERQPAHCLARVSVIETTGEGFAGEPLRKSNLAERLNYSSAVYLASGDQDTYYLPGARTNWLARRMNSPTGPNQSQQMARDSSGGYSCRYKVCRTVENVRPTNVPEMPNSNLWIPIQPARRMLGLPGVVRAVTGIRSMDCTRLMCHGERAMSTYQGIMV
ncbi:uncharacterized protein CLUP02_12499 [Colletotrichum lupini]|uniref:Uncharacterized protein n=1 Tax=Colletotrichum lupini TaxID=145971 RepID=A0A9Q8T0P2_9PEZI|nr:uncharacterized protein CLUP02_12499 [Colletotrichum lupini]UQC86997.1 hypothetical protein CLUP02_12499 [Colletotrichum lupini]